jgi:arsenite transporter
MSKLPSHSEEIAQTPPKTHPFTLSSDIEKQSPPLEKAQATSITEKETVFKSLGWLDRFLALWIFLAMAVGIILGNFVPNTGPALQKGKLVGVSVPIGMSSFFLSERGGGMLMVLVAVGLLVMMYPILCKVRYESLHNVLGKRDIWVQILFSVVVNWIIAPPVMVCRPRF